MKPELKNTTEEKKEYSSDLVEFLLTNNRFSFWAKDWSKRIIVDWNTKIKLEKFRQDVIKKVGQGFMYERTICNDNTDYIATDKGLVKP